MANLLTRHTGRRPEYITASRRCAGGRSKGIGDLILSRFRIDSDDSQLLVAVARPRTSPINVNGYATENPNCQRAPAPRLESYRLAGDR